MQAISARANRRFGGRRAPSNRRSGRGGGGGKPRQPPFRPPPGAVTKDIDNAVQSWASRGADLCGVWTRRCAERYTGGDTLGLPAPSDDEPARRHPMRRIFKDGRIPSSLDVFPDLPAWSLGSCALVAVGDNLLRAKHGKAIDAHDTVIRYNAPVKAYAQHVGRRSTVVYWKVRNNEKQYGQEGDLGAKFVTFKDATKYHPIAGAKELKKGTFRGKPVLWPSDRGAEIWKTAYESYMRNVKGAPSKAASGGFKLACDVVGSGLCTRVSLYGFTSEGSGKYFDRSAMVKLAHFSGLEHFALRRMMEGLAEASPNVCIYD